MKHLCRRHGLFIPCRSAPKKRNTFQYGASSPNSKGCHRLAARFGVSAPVIAERAHAPIVGDLVAAVKAVSNRGSVHSSLRCQALPVRAARAAQRHGRPFAFDAEDFHVGDLADLPANAFDKSLIGSIECRYLPKASYVTAASQGIAEAYAAEYGIEQPKVILNTFPKRLRRRRTPSPRGVIQPRPSLYWFSQTIGPDRGLECAVRAIARAKSIPHLFLRGVPTNGYKEKLAGLAREVGAGERLHFLAPAPPAQMESLAAKYDIGFVGETEGTLNRRIALTNKQFTCIYWRVFQPRDVGCGISPRLRNLGRWRSVLISHR